MEIGQTSAIRRFILWEYPRASWQYDVIVALILGFIFLTPRSVFQDEKQAASIAQVPSEQGERAFFLEPKLLQSIPDSERNARAKDLLRSRYGKSETVLQVEPIFDPEHQLKGYMVFTRP